MMRLHATLFVTTLLMAAPAVAGDAAPAQHAANTPRPASAMKTVDINDVVNPSTALAEAKVEDAKGAPVGSVQRVVTGETGTVARVEVALKTPQKVVSLTTEQLRYVPFTGSLRAALPADQISALPAAKGQ